MSRFSAANRTTVLPKQVSPRYCINHCMWKEVKFAVSINSFHKFVQKRFSTVIILLLKQAQRFKSKRGGLWSEIKCCPSIWSFVKVVELIHPILNHALIYLTKFSKTERVCFGGWKYVIRLSGEMGKRIWETGKRFGNTSQGFWGLSKAAYQQKKIYVLRIMFSFHGLSIPSHIS